VEVADKQLMKLQQILRQSFRLSNVMPVGAELSANCAVSISLSNRLRF
jgi:hypothetical protein